MVSRADVISQAQIVALTAIVRTIPLAFHRLAAIGDALHADIGVTTAMRGVMQSLALGGPQTVPQMAEARPVSRQHIQKIVDALLERGLVQSRANPAHRRSPHIELTREGRQLFAAMQIKERGLLSQIAAKLETTDIAAIERGLANLADALKDIVATIRKEQSDDN